MKKGWWQHPDKPVYVLLFGGSGLLRCNAALGGTLAIIGFVTAIVYFFMQQKES
ncbi:MAG TPA: hypothetical protein VK167_11510 [Flavipsychrobacter sp.]|nr:hypothetical protein [Flavipsychrobacter sp.]